MTTPSFLDELRQATHAAHAALDARASIDDHVTREHYIAFLRGSLAAVERVEPAILPFADDGSGERLTRAACLRADLRALDAEPREVSTPHAPISELASEAGAVGATYVVEGSALGGVVMARTVDPALGLAGRAQSYLRFRGEHTGDAWRRCVAALKSWGEAQSAEQRRTACAAACAVFALYERSLEDAGALGRRTV